MKDEEDDDNITPNEDDLQQDSNDFNEASEDFEDIKTSAGAVQFMKNKKSIITLLIILLPLFGFSQKQFLDYFIDKNKDTVYGTIRKMNLKKGVLFERNINSKKDRIKFRSHKINNQLQIRFNDVVYNYLKPSDEDGIYAVTEKKIISNDSVAKSIGNYISIQKRLSDFVITNQNDTIFGKIEDPTFGSLRLTSLSNAIIKIEEDAVKSYRFNNDLFEFREKKKVGVFDKKAAYLKLVLDGKSKLYEYEYNTIGWNSTSGPLNYGYNSNGSIATATPVNAQMLKYYFIEKDNDLVYIDNFLYKKRLAELFSDNKTLASKILDGEYTIENIYLIVKYFNENN